VSDGVVRRKVLCGMSSLGGRGGLRDGDVYRDVRDDSEHATEPVSEAEKRVEEVEAKSDFIFIVLSDEMTAIGEMG
jgi:hypothetical protein